MLWPFSLLLLSLRTFSFSTVDSYEATKNRIFEEPMRSLVVLLALVGVISAVAIMKPRQHNKALCGLCETFVGKIETDVENDETDIMKKANTYCDDMFHNVVYDDFCKSMVDKEIENVVQKLKDKERPEVICVDLKMCDKQ